MRTIVAVSMMSLNKKTSNGNSNNSERLPKATEAVEESDNPD